MDRLDDLLLFARVVRHNGFSAAARSLGLQRSTVSRRIAGLERRLDVRLFQRNTRRIALTPVGEEIYLHAGKLADTADAISSAAQAFHGEPRGTLRMTGPSPFTEAVLTPLLGEFTSRYPALRVVVDASDRTLDLVGEGFDLAFRAQASPLKDSDLVARRIGDVQWRAVAAASLLRNGPVQHPEQLAELGMVAHATHEGQHSLRWLHHARNEYTLHYAPRLVSGNICVLRAAAMVGMGVACLPTYLCEDALHEEKLIEALAADTGWQPAPSQMYVILPARKGVAPAARLFLEFATPRIASILAGDVPATVYGSAELTHRLRCD